LRSWQSLWLQLSQLWVHSLMMIYLLNSHSYFSVAAFCKADFVRRWFSQGDFGAKLIFSDFWDAIHPR